MRAISCESLITAFFRQGINNDVVVLGEEDCNGLQCAIGELERVFRQNTTTRFPVNKNDLDYIKDIILDVSLPSSMDDKRIIPWPNLTLLYLENGGTLPEGYQSIGMGISKFGYVLLIAYNKNPTPLHNVEKPYASYKHPNL